MNVCMCVYIHYIDTETICICSHICLHIYIYILLLISFLYGYIITFSVETEICNFL